MKLINEYCSNNKMTVFNFFMAIYGIYIGEITNLDEFVIGTPILNRTNFKEKSAINRTSTPLPLSYEG